ncbi:hypothetical protein Leryth_011122 [Lithospermum erythrorhizon]|nr:hypothetical protein Leryth_011122 [Lithospermum erythrorhizon]
MISTAYPLPPPPPPPPLPPAVLTVYRLSPINGCSWRKLCSYEGLPYDKRRNVSRNRKDQCSSCAEYTTLHISLLHHDSVCGH